MQKMVHVCSSGVEMSLFLPFGTYLRQTKKDD